MPGVYQGRALPVAWLVRKGQKGHFPAEMHRAWVDHGEALLPAGAQGVWRGAGACAGTVLQPTREERGWSDGCRTALRTTATWEGPPLRLASLGACRTPGPWMALTDVLCTEAAEGPLLGMCWWATGDPEPR